MIFIVMLISHHRYRLEHPGKTTYVADLRVSLCSEETSDCTQTYSILKDSMMISPKCEATHKRRYTRQA